MSQIGDRGPDYGSEYDQKQYLKRKGRQREQLLKQFCRLEGQSGNSRAYLEGWERIFGGQRDAR